ncbi:Protein pid-1 [Caenorhabditis elegans]|uniref:Protein pid-1 n=1 Tax=Caenorhabditis elegans TaxID=6239 RepID=PID1_CAEEL|nr:Protein pid-1 [Caenorhabditis elegans]Q19541.1 RecName: Full=Protein pid-1; AltName: Full=PiRNA-induced silencing defective protein 1 [Caenorhabditis elegans]CCD62046.1 Protein pid-1 [Caenorhabditis elegans]|eukprot:NP_495613.1 21U-RNA biogenesis factor pid-1 [Caenorhabditis elegans]
MSAKREFSHITLASTPFKKRIDQNSLKTDSDIEKDTNIAHKCAERFNYNTNLHRKVTLSDRFELAALGYEMKAKPRTIIEKHNDCDEFHFIYRKEKKNDYGTGSPLSAGLSLSNPLPAGRGFLSPAIQNTSNQFTFSGSPRITPQKHTPVSANHKPARSIFDDIPSNIA